MDFWANENLGALMNKNINMQSLHKFFVFGIEDELESGIPQK
jgi:hypothetical protein